MHIVQLRFFRIRTHVTIRDLARMPPAINSGVGCVVIDIIVVDQVLRLVISYYFRLTIFVGARS